MTFRVLLLDASAFEGDDVACLGRHVASVIREIEQIIPNAIWYVADVSVNQPTPLELVGGAEPHLVGDSTRVIESCERVDQFLSGRFWACRVDTPLRVDGYRVRGRLFTDSVESELGGAAFELRAFDTSYIEIYAEDERALIHLGERLRGSLVTR